MNEAQVNVRVFAHSGAFDPIDLYLHSNSSGGAPGSSQETLGTDLIGPASIIVDSGFTFALTGGTQYWLVMTPFDSRAESNVGWFSEGRPAVQSDFSVITENSSSPWTSLGDLGLQFEIDGTLTPSVPEPGTVGLVAAGLGLVALTIKRSRIV